MKARVARGVIVMKNAILGRIRKEGLQEVPGKDEIIARMAFALFAGLLRQWLYRRRLKDRERRKAERKVIRLTRKGKEVPEELMQEAKKGLGRRARKKFDKKLEEVKGEKRKIFINKKLAVLLFALLIIGLIIRLRRD